MAGQDGGVIPFSNLPDAGIRIPTATYYEGPIGASIQSANVGTVAEEQRLGIVPQSTVWPLYMDDLVLAAGYDETLRICTRRRHNGQ
jgi:hypothetical protein